MSRGAIESSSTTFTAPNTQHPHASISPHEQPNPVSCTTHPNHHALHAHADDDNPAKLVSRHDGARRPRRAITITGPAHGFSRVCFGAQPHYTCASSRVATFSILRFFRLALGSCCVGEIYTVRSWWRYQYLYATCDSRFTPFLSSWSSPMDFLVFVLCLPVLHCTSCNCIIADLASRLRREDGSAVMPSVRFPGDGFWWRSSVAVYRIFILVEDLPCSSNANVSFVSKLATWDEYFCRELLSILDSCSCWCVLALLLRRKLVPWFKVCSAFRFPLSIIFKVISYFWRWVCSSSSVCLWEKYVIYPGLCVFESSLLFI